MSIKKQDNLLTESKIFADWHNRQKSKLSKRRSFDDKSVVLIGAPNVGKSTFFNKLSTKNTEVSNVDRMTVESTIGFFKKDHHSQIIDLPGIYNLSHPLDEELVVAHEFWHGRFSSIANIIGAQSIERDLYLTIQCLETGLLNNIIINMKDEVNINNLNVKKLQKILGVNIIISQANKTIDIDNITKALVRGEKGKDTIVKYSPEIESKISAISKLLPKRRISNRFYAISMLENNEFISTAIKKYYPEEFIKIKEVIAEKNYYEEITETKRRYIDKLLKIVLENKQEGYFKPVNLNRNKVDKVFINKLTGIPIFILILILIYFISFSPWTGGGIQTQLDILFNNVIISKIHNLYQSSTPTVLWINGFIVDGLLAGFFSVLSFLPVITILFLLMTIINQIGLLTRMSVLLDDALSHFGLSGRAIINLVTGFGCSVPAIMMARTNNSIKERAISIIITPFMCCTARTVVIAFVANALFPLWGWLITIGFVVLTGIIGLLFALIFSQTLFRKQKTFLCIEMVNWRKPDPYTIFKSVWQQVKSFLLRAGIIILIASGLVWLLCHMSIKLSWSQWYDDANINHTIMADIGRGVDYIFKPIWWNQPLSWRLTTSLMACIPAKEIAIANLNLLFPTGINQITIAAGLSYMTIFMLFIPCSSTLITLVKEGGWKKAAISVGSSFLISYVLAAMVYWIAFFATL